MRFTGLCITIVRFKVESKAPTLETGSLLHAVLVIPGEHIVWDAASPCFDV